MPVTSDSTTVTITDAKNPNTSVKILNYGATVLSWKVDGKEQLWLSEASKLDGSKAVRGGIPLVFPRFGPAKGNHPDTDKLPQHGFARNSHWEFLGQVDEATAQFGLGPENLDADLKAAWDHDFSLIYTVKLAGPDALQVSLDVVNPGTAPFDFNVLLHTYYRVPEVTDVSVQGFNDLAFVDKVGAGGEKKQGQSPITINEEVDRIYKDTPKTATIESKGKTLFTVTASESLKDTVVWNPWTEKARGMSDFEPKDGFHQMICVENGYVAQFNKLPAGEKWNCALDIKAHI